MPNPLNRISHDAVAKSADIQIYDTISQSDWYGTNARSFTQALAALGDVKEIHVRINSPGGSCFDAMAIYNALKNHPATVTVHVDGIALSAASVVAMAGDTIEMAENAVMMIHEARVDSYGTAAQLRSDASMLEAINTGMIKTYSDRTGLAAADVTTLVVAETWFTAAEAKTKGFCTAISPNKSVSAKCDLSKIEAQFKNVPTWCRQALAQFQKEAPMPDPTPNPAPANQPAAPVAGAVPPVPPVAPVATAPAVAPAAVATTPAPVAAVVDVTAAVSAAVDASLKAERKRVADITALCAKAKHPEASAAFIAEGLGVSDVQAKLFDQMCKDNVPVGDGGQPDPAAPPDPTAKFKAEYAAQKDVYARLNVTEAEYVKQRQSDPQ